MYKKIRAIALNSKAEGKTADYLSNVLKRDARTLEKVMRKTGLTKEDIFKQIEPHIKKELEKAKKPQIEITKDHEIKKEGDK